MEYCKLQIGCMLIVLYVTFIYVWEQHEYKVKKREYIYEWILIIGILSIAFDGITAYTVNHLEQVPKWLNDLFHLCFLCSLNIIVFLMFLYITDITRGISKQIKYRILLSAPLCMNILTVIVFMPKLTYRYGEITNYSMGVSVYICFTMITLYMLATVIILLTSWRSLGKHKLITISSFLVVYAAVAIYQITHPQALITCLLSTFAIVGNYLNMENPIFTKLQTYNQEMVMGFATLVENRDGSTGGHIKRTSEYARTLACELSDRGFYKEQLTRDYINNLTLAAPMHDVGKIAIPDAILQKPGRLTQEEYDIMKTHAERGGVIIHNTFRNIGNDEYEKMAYEVARYHHEKWNGKGYPDGLSRKNIPLCARIMSVADVFDAVSAKRCYRDALPLDECFRIIEKGSGQDFDPIIVEVFLDIKNEIKEICEKNNG